MSDKSTVVHNGRVSVCIPSYNASRFIRQTIKSVLASSYTNLEGIVNDDASTDSTRAIVEGIDDNRVRFFQNERTIGVPGNWNYALQRAAGEFVGLLNHDDLYLRLASRYPLYYSSNPNHAAWRMHSDNLTHHWGLVDQVSEGLKTLQKAFCDDTLPEELRTYKQTVYTYLYGKVLSRAL